MRANVSSFHDQLGEGPSPSLAESSLSFKFRDAEFGQLWEELHFPDWISPIPAWAHCVPGLGDQGQQRAYGDRGQACRSWPSQAAPPGRLRSCHPRFGRARAAPGCRCHRLPSTAGESHQSGSTLQARLGLEELPKCVTPGHMGGGGSRRRSMC